MHTLTFGEIEALSNKYNLYMDTWASDYGEPGYSLSENSQGVLLGDWNDCPKHVRHVLEKQFDLEWFDEWTTATDSLKAYRTSPDCYSWLPYYVIIDGEIVGGDECEADPEWYIEEYLLNDSDHVLSANIKINLTEHGFVLCDDSYENGFHPGQDDVPSEILAKAKIKWPNCEFTFGDCTKGQFDVSFSLYRRERSLENDSL